jgi:hypothetical protein
VSETFYAVSVDCADAAATARFWAGALGRQVADDPTAEHAVVLVGEPDLGPRLAFHQVPEAKTVKNRLHFDLVTADFEGESDRLVALGAQKVRDVEHGGAKWTTFVDVEGNEFDLISAPRGRG